MDSILEPVLPAVDGEFDVVHLKTRQHNSRRLIYRKPPRGAEKQELDRVTTHLFLVSHEEMTFYALEVYVYESEEFGQTINTLFVSKADTTGHYYHTDAVLSIKELTTALLRLMLRHYVNPNGIVRICLFAKAEKQYLFPFSSKNPKKHLMPDALLVKWWARTLDPLVNEFEKISKTRLQIPGADSKSIGAFFPPNAQMQWQVGDIFWSDPDDPRKDLPAVKCIPRFPDDPKIRFLDFLVDERRALKVSREQFWLELQARQEFRLGSVVGIIGIEGTIPKRAPIDNDSNEILVRKFKSLREVLISCDYSTKEAAQEAYLQMMKRVPASCKFKLTGRASPRAAVKKVVAAAPVNMLNASLIRKKKK
ncbi:histone acetyltransferase Rtt109p [Trichomonascus vanleenenianus]|uniref:H3 histone acetyltransferase RTT109 n=1 Tax=Trichomonascus vanleenenianus TaxID=2268995 RepID=UPI003ECBA7BF